jgi:hypothetical protein
LNDRNLIPHRFAKGVSGNPKGRPRGSRTIGTAVRAILASRFSKNQTVAEAVVEGVKTKALRGDIAAATFLADRSEGRPATAISLALAAPPPMDGESREGLVSRIMAEVYGVSVPFNPELPFESGK